MRRTAPTPETITPDLLPPDPVARQALTERLILDPIRHRIVLRPWARLTDAEWEELAPTLWALGCGFPPPGARRGGRPMTEAAVRARLDAIFRAVTLKHPKGGRGAWRQMPEEHGKADTASRGCRRWAQRGLWARLLEEVAHPTAPPVLKRLAYWVCCAFRRSFTAIGAGRAIALARKLKMFAALPAPSGWLPDRGLSESFAPLIGETMRRIGAEPGWRPPLHRSPRSLGTRAAQAHAPIGRPRLDRSAFAPPSVPCSLSAGSRDCSTPSPRRASLPRASWAAPCPRGRRRTA